MKVTIIPQKVAAVISSLGSLYTLIKSNEETLRAAHPSLKEVILTVEHNSIEALMATARNSSRSTFSEDRSTLTIALVFFMEPTADKIAQSVSKEIENLTVYSESIAS